MTWLLKKKKLTVHVRCQSYSDGT